MSRPSATSWPTRRTEGHHRHRRGGDRPEGRPLRRGQPGRVLLPGPVLRRRRGLPELVDGPNGPGTNLHDTNSGFNAQHAGYLHLAADQALAFVRERDNLPNGDLDRTHRQQAVLDYVIWKLKTGGVLTDVGQLTGLLSTADKYLITDSSWNLLDFSTQMHALSGENLKFYTRRSSATRPSTARTPTRSTSPPSRRRSRRSSPPRRRQRAASRPRSRPRRPPRSRPRRPSRLTSTTAAAPAGWPAASRPRWSRRATGPASSPTRPRSRRPVKPGTRCSTARGPRPTRPRSRG